MPKWLLAPVMVNDVAIGAPVVPSQSLAIASLAMIGSALAVTFAAAPVVPDATVVTLYDGVNVLAVGTYAAGALTADLVAGQYSLTARMTVSGNVLTSPPSLVDIVSSGGGGGGTVTLVDSTFAWRDDGVMAGNVLTGAASTTPHAIAVECWGVDTGTGIAWQAPGESYHLVNGTILLAANGDLSFVPDGVGFWGLDFDLQFIGTDATSYDLADVAVTVVAAHPILPEPNAQGIFNFSRPDHTLLSGVNASFHRVDGLPIQLEVMTGALQIVAGHGNTQTPYTYPSGQVSSNQYLAARVGRITGGAMQFAMHIAYDILTATPGYLVGITATTVTLYRGGVWQFVFAHGVDLTTTSAVFAVSLQANALQILIDGVVARNIAEPVPIAGADQTFYLGMNAGDDVNGLRIDSMTFVRGAVL